MTLKAEYTVESKGAVARQLVRGFRTIYEDPDFLAHSRACARLEAGSLYRCLGCGAFLLREHCAQTIGQGELVHDPTHIGKFSCGPVALHRLFGLLLLEAG